MLPSFARPGATSKAWRQSRCSVPSFFYPKAPITTTSHARDRGTTAKSPGPCLAARGFVPYRTTQCHRIHSSSKWLDDQVRQQPKDTEEHDSHDDNSSTKSEVSRSGKKIDSATTHYETLDIPHDAPSSEIKRSFYRLSKQHHPDRNPSSEHASRRFIKLGDAYGVLIHPERRRVYDRSIQHIYHQRHSAAARHPHHNAQHRGAGHAHPNVRYAGGRPASGLSKQRGTFQGPPPSFWNHGGFGSHADRWQEARDGMAHAQSQSQSRSHDTAASAHGFESPRAGGFSNATAEQSHTPFGTGHFNAKAHEAAQRMFEEHAAAARQRRINEIAKEHVDEGTLFRIFMIMTTLAIILTMPNVGTWMSESLSSSKPKVKEESAQTG